MEDDKKVEVPAKFEKIVGDIEKMTVLDLAELVKILEDKFGVSAAAPAMMMAPGAGAAEAVEEKDEFDVEIAAQELLGSCYKDKNNQNRPMFNLTISQAKQVLVRESKIVRKAVIKRLEELESLLPKKSFQIEDPIKRAEAWIEEQKAFKRTKSQIADKQTATALNTASQKVKENNKLKEQLGMCEEYATILNVQKMYKKLKVSWRVLKEYSISNELEVKDVPCPRFGKVKSYSKEAWLNCYNIDLTDLF
jgi:large subunit ribosomal protein L7/L12